MRAVLKRACCSAIPSILYTAHPICRKSYITICDDIRKTAWHNGLTQYISSNPHLNYADFTTIKGALQIASDLNVKIGRTAITRLISNNGCGFRLSGMRGQWVVDREKFLSVLNERI